MNISDAQTVPIDTVQPYGENPRKGDVELIADSLGKNGQYRPITVNKRDGKILTGNHTWKAAKTLGWEEIAVAFVDVDEATARRIVLVDNRSNDIASYDNYALAALLEAAEADGGLLGTGFDDEALKALVDLVAGPPDLEELAAAYDPDGDPTANYISIKVRVPQEVAERWDRHRENFNDDAVAFEALL